MENESPVPIINHYFSGTKVKAFINKYHSEFRGLFKGPCGLEVLIFLDLSSAKFIIEPIPKDVHELFFNHST